MAFPLREDGDQDVGAGHVLAPRGLDVDDGPLNHPLKAWRGLGVLAVIDDQGLELVVDIVGECRLEHAKVDVAGLHDPDGVLVLGE